MHLTSSSRKTSLQLISCISIFALLFSGCGGGGGNSSSDPSVTPAYVNLDVVPKNLDAGDKTTVIVYVQDINPDGIFLKIRTPLSVLYVNNSGFLEIDGQDQNLDPDFYQADATYNYLVYRLPAASIPPGKEGKIIVQYQAIAAVAAGMVAVDADYNDPDINDAVEFDVKNPLFTPIDSVDIVVAN